MSTFTSSRDAARYAGVSHQSICNWAKIYNIGRVENRKLLIDKSRLDQILAARDHIREIRGQLRP